MNTKKQEKIHKKIYLQKEVLISSLYVGQNRKYVYHMKDFILLKNAKKKNKFFDAFTSDRYQ